MYCTYNPQDDKLRIEGQLDQEEYERVKAAGFRWAPHQKLFYAVWNPGAEDVATDLCGDIELDDTSREERAEDRAERFEGYRENRTRDAQAARERVSSIADNIPLGQPILVGHHSERHARRDAEKIENGMRRAVKMWETAQYWKSRAKGSLLHAERMERPDVRARRIKTLEADQRKHKRSQDECEKFLKTYRDPEAMTAKLRDGRELLPALLGTYKSGLSLEQQRKFEKQEISFPEALKLATDSLAARSEYAQRWITHIENRLVFEREMLGISGGLPEEKWADVKPGGRVLVGGSWLIVLKVNKKAGKVSSLSTNRRYVSKIGIEEVTEYEPPTEEQAEKMIKATKLPPIVNFPMEGAKHVTQAEWNAKHKDYKGTRYADATETTGRYRYRVIHASMASYPPCYITDAKRVDPPKLAAEHVEPVSIPAPRPDLSERVRVYRPHQPTEEEQQFDALKQTLKAGVKTFSAPQLFPTPRQLAARMVEMANIQPGERVLEPEAGTAAIVREILAAAPDIELTAVEIDSRLASNLSSMFPDVKTMRADFLECTPEQLGKFDVILMNPPFANGADIAHIEHAKKFLRPNGRLVGICANGPQRHEKLKPMVELLGGEWEQLPRDTFQESGTMVNSVLLSFEVSAEEANEDAA